MKAHERILGGIHRAVSPHWRFVEELANIAAIFVGQAFHDAGLLALSPTITLPDVDSSLLAGFGIWQCA